MALPWDKLGAAAAGSRLAPPWGRLCAAAGAARPAGLRPALPWGRLCAAGSRLAAGSGGGPLAAAGRRAATLRARDVLTARLLRRGCDGRRAGATRPAGRAAKTAVATCRRRLSRAKTAGARRGSGQVDVGGGWAAGLRGRRRAGSGLGRSRYRVSRGAETCGVRAIQGLRRGGGLRGPETGV